MSRCRKVFNIKRYVRLGYHWRRFTAPDKKKSVFNRWKQLAKDETFRELFLDNGLLTLSEELFGEIPGTWEFVEFIKP